MKITNNPELELTTIEIPYRQLEKLKAAFRKIKLPSVEDMSNEELYIAQFFSRL